MLCLLKKLYLLLKVFNHLDIQDTPNGLHITFKSNTRIDIDGEFRSNADCYYFNCDNDELNEELAQVSANLPLTEKEDREKDTCAV